MRKSWLLCVLLGTLAWGQAQPESVPAPAPKQAPAGGEKAPDAAAEVPESAVVLTIQGVCPAPPKTPAATQTATGKTAAATKTAAKKPANCKTEITRKQFETIAKGLSPNVTPQLKRQLEQALPRFMALSEIAKEKGLDKTEQYKQTLKIATMQILSSQLQREVNEDSDKISDSEINDYYKKNPEAYEQYSLDRLFVPRFKQAAPEEKEENGKDAEKQTDEQQKAKEAADKAKQEEGEKQMSKLADDLRARAAAGEDFVKLQKEAFEAAGTKVDNPTVNLPTVRRTALPPAHAAVFELKKGEVSQVISDNGGHYVYKVETKEVLPLDDKIKAEIHNKLKSEKMKETMDKYTNSFQAVPNEAYFGPAAPSGPGGMRQAPPPHMPRPQMTPPPGQPQSAPPSGEAPPSKPN